MTKDEKQRIQAWIKETEEQIEWLEKMREIYKNAKELRNYYEAQQDALETNLDAFEFYMGKWKKCKSE